MKKTKLLLLLLLLFPLSNILQAQVITGTITDGTAKPLRGASISIKGQNKTVLSDTLGKYAITLKDPANEVLIFAFIGYQSIERKAGDQRTINITLQSNASDLDSVVVVGYGTQKSRLVSNSISSMNAKQIEEMPIRNIAEAMQGQMAGVQVQTTNGSPGTAPVIRIRGIGSLGAGNDPLYVVDGYPLSSSENFDQLNPADIENIEVLKDAAAAAIYGSRGGNGVIIITTKRGKPGKTSFSYATTLSIDQVSKKMKLLDGPQYLDYVKEALFYDGRTGVVEPTNLDDPSTMANTNWQDVIFRNAFTQNHQLNASGGNTAVRFSLSGNYTDQDGIVIGTAYKRYAFRANLDAKLTDKLKVSVNIAPAYTVRDERPVSSDQFVSNYTSGLPLSSGTIGVGNIALLQTALYLPPTIPVRLPNGDYNQPTTDPYMKNTSLAIPYYNPLATANLMKDRSEALRLISNFNIQYEIIKKLVFTVNVGAETFNNRRNMFIPSTMAYLSSPTSTLSNPNLNGVLAQQRSNQNYNWLWENTLNYTFDLGTKHHFTALAGYSAQANTLEASGLASQAGSFGSDAVEYISTSSSIVGTAQQSKSSLVSMFSRLNYNFGEKYLLAVALRRDGSSRFGENKKYASFPSVSVGWRLSKEAFLENTAWINELKLRASYGVTGNNNIGDYAAVASLVASNYTLGTGIGSPYYGFSLNGFSNPDLTWEQNKQTDIGLDLAFLNNRVSLTADVYERNSDKLLANTPISSLAGFAGSYLRNVGTIRNRGLELHLVTKNLTGKFQWSTDLNFSLNRNKITEYYKKDGDYYAAVFGWNTVFQVQQGGSVGDIYGYVADGVFKNQKEADAGPKWESGGSKPGDLRFKDMKADGVINTDDRTVFANTQPKFTYGATNSFSYKGMDVRIFLQGVQGSNAVYGLDRFVMSGGGFYNSSTEILDRWKSETDPGNGEVPRYNAAGGSSEFSSRYVQDASYLRIRNITLGYSFSQKAIKNLKLKTIRVYLSGQNLFTFTSYPGFNPEVNIEGKNVFRTNVDQGGYPFARSYALGFNVGF
jgi:TonB-linked SusC/RagA family outer membrane protein